MEKYWLITQDWDHYDMKRPVWRSPVGNEDVKEFTRKLYKAALNPLFVARKVLSVNTLDDFRYYLKAAKKVFAHISDFS